MQFADLIKKFAQIRSDDYDTQQAVLMYLEYAIEAVKEKNYDRALIFMQGAMDRVEGY